MASWVDEETATADLGDRRLNSRLKAVMNTLGDHPSLSIPGACHSHAEMVATYRLFSNDSVDREKVLSPHIDATKKRASTVETVLVVQDTTETDFTRPTESLGGPLNGGRRRGHLIHTLLALTPAGLPLGLVAAEMWKRPECASKKKAYRKKPPEQRESRRWLQGYDTINRFKADLPEGCRVVALSDSEGDIYECLAAPQMARDANARSCANFIVRACHDRVLATGADGLYATVAKAPLFGRATVQVRAQRAASHDGRQRKRAKTNREAEVEIRATRVNLKAPEGKRAYADAVVNAILIRELDPPAGEPVVDWLLLTDLPIWTRAEIDDVIAFYTCRWQIEIYFRALKSGCAIEELQLEEDERLEPCIALYMIIAWRLMYLTMLSRTHPDLPADVALKASELKSVYVYYLRKTPPAKAPPLRAMIVMIAALGGYIARKGDGEPGPKTLWIGLQRMRDMSVGWEMKEAGLPCPRWPEDV